MATRKIVQIDEEKCNGCGECVPSCAEGAIQIVDGKAKLVSDVYCDGLGACLGTCPEDAIAVIEREAPEFDEEAALRHVEKLKTPAPAAAHGGCPGMAVRNLQPGLPISGMPQRAASGGGDPPGGAASALGNWPIQLHLVPPNAPFLGNCDLLLVADCVPFAYADFHRRLLQGRPVVIGCPKLDDGQLYVEKLAAMLKESSIRSVTVVHMEVPCCTGLVRIAEAAIEASGCGVPLEDVTISIRGEVLEADPAVQRPTH
jgi:Pyruvate/2-oxoacid:ferredoxin oxidoreductase delta subunit